MKSSNFKILILLTIALIIWGRIAYRYINGESPNTPQVNTQDIVVSYKPKTYKLADTFTIAYPDRDPFLGILASRKTKASKKQTQSSKLKSPKYNIVYKGLVKQQQTNNEIFVVEINNTQHLLKQGQSIQDVKLLGGNSKKIKLLVNGKQQIVENK